MLNIVLIRVDDRLIHGQVMTGWIKVTQANRILIIDDLTARNPFMKNVLEMVAPTSVRLDVCTIDQAQSELMKDSSAGERVLILVKSPLTLRTFVERGEITREIIVGGIGMGPGRSSFYKNISVSTEELEALKYFVSRGVKVFMQVVPDDRKVDVESLFRKS